MSNHSLIAVLLLALPLVACQTPAQSPAPAKELPPLPIRTIEIDPLEVIPVATLPPRYPKHAVDNGIEGHVCFAFTVLPSGKVSDLRVYDSKPEGVFEQEATRVFSKWMFKPKLVGNELVAAHDNKYCLDFRLE